jgi:2-methylisocitrate lyase-like PEP mutase family enzyme
MAAVSNVSDGSCRTKVSISGVIAMSPELLAKAKAFRELNAKGHLLLPNAWDAVSARMFEEAGFAAIGTTSAGIAYTRGVRDGQRISRLTMMHEVAIIAGAVRAPVSADIESGYGADPQDVAQSVGEAMRAGAVGINLEDNAHLPSGAALFDPRLQCERIRAARREADGHDVSLTINARTDTFLVRIGADDAERVRLTIERGLAYLASGADLVFVPILTDLAVIRTLSKVFDGRLSVMAMPGAPRADEFFEAGVRRVSIGQTAMLATLGYLRSIADEMRSSGSWSKIESTFYGFGTAEALFRA